MGKGFQIQPATGIDILYKTERRFAQIRGHSFPFAFQKLKKNAEEKLCQMPVNLVLVDY